MSDIINTAIKTTLLPASGEDKGIKKNVSVVLDTCIMDSNSSAFNFRNFFSNPTEAKWPDIPFTPTNVLSISEFSSEPLSKVDLELTSEPPKKSESKPDLVVRRKSKMKNLHMLDDEKMLDTDLADLVKSMETDKKLDSDSSADAIFEDDINNNKTNYGSMKNLQFCGKSNILSKNKKNSTAYYRKKLPESNSYINTPKNSALVNSFIDSKYSHPYATPPSISLLKEARSSSAVPTICNVPNNNILPISTVPANSIFKSKITEVKKLQQGYFICDSQMPAPNVSQSNKGESTPFSNQSIYASMGLDEDLCDIKTPKTVEKCDSYHTSNKQEVTGSNNKTASLCQEFANVPIKIENITPPTSPCKVENKIHSNSSVSINDMHVSMTFETDPYDDELDDMPLSFLKDRVADKNSSEAEKDNKNVIAASSNNSVGIPIFIKKESIQNEIAWEGPEIFSQNISPEHSKDNINVASSSNLTGLISMEGDRDLPATLVPVAVKIKTEPNTEFEFSKSTFKMSCSESLHQASFETANKRKTSNIQINIKNKIVFNESDSINYALPIVNSVGENSFKLCDTNSNRYNKPSAIIEAETNNCVISASAKDNLLSDASLSHSNMEQAKSIIPQTSLGSCFSEIQTNIQKQVEKQNDSNFGTNIEKFSNTSEQLSNMPQINKTDLVGVSDISTESISPKNKSRKRKSTKISTGGARKNFPAAGEICDEFSAEITEYKEKCNMDEITKEFVNVDENLPITILIKRKKTNLYDSHTFHYTSINKSEISERTLLNENVGNKTQSSILNPEENLSEKVDSSLSSFENSSPKKISVRKRKRIPKKSLVKKRVEKNIPNNIDKNEIFNNPDDYLSGNLETNAVSTNESKSLYDTNTSSNFSKGDSASFEKKNSHTFVYMSFEEQNSPIDEASEEYFQSVLSCAKRNSLLYSDNIDKTNTSIMKKIENENILLSEVQSKNLEQSKSMITEEQCSAILEISSDLTSVTTNSQQLTDDQAIPKLIDNNSISKKKKKRPRTFGWSKKKKQKSKITLTNLSTNVITSSVSLNEVVPVPEKVDAPTQTPVVIIKNLVPDGEKAVFSNEHKIHKNFLEKQDIIIPIVKEGKKIVCKRKRTAKSKQNKKIVKSSISENAKVDNSQNSNSETSTILKENASVNLSPKNDNITTVSSLVCKESEIDIGISKTLLNKDKNSEILNVFNSPIKPFCSSITQNNSNESYLKATNKFIQDEENSNNSIKSPSQNNLPKNFEDVMAANKNSGFTGNILCTSNTSHFPDLKSASNTANESVQLISIKKEIGDDYQIVKSMNQPKSLNTVCDTFDVASSVDNFRSNETQVVNNASCAENLTSIKHEVPADNTHKEFRRVDSCPNLGYNSLCTNHSISSNNMNISVHQSLEVNNTAAVTDNFQHADQLALSIKKEICDKAKAGSYQFSSLNAIRSQDDLIEKITLFHSISPSNVVNTLSNATKDFSSEKQNIEPETTATAVQNSNAGNVTDDEIQVLEIDTDNSKNVPFVDLTDDNTVVLIPNKQENKVNAKKNSPRLPLQHIRCNNNEIHTKNSKGSILTPTNISIKENAVFNQNNQRLIQMRHNSISPSVSERDSISPLLNNKIYSLPQGFAYLFPSDNRTSDPFIFRQKYRHEYLKYPFPSSVLSHSSNQRNKHKIYTRINSQSLNLSIEKVESRLKNSDKVKTQFGNKLGDIVKLKKYPVSTSEVECYHRILGVAPSHKLLSKCFKPSDKTTSTILKDDIAVVSEFQTPVCAYKERSNQQNSLNSSLNNILGISNIKNTKTNNSDFHTVNEVYDRDCPSTNTVDSCDSYISNLSDKFVHAVEKKAVNNGNILKKNEQFGIYIDAGASGRNLVLSCATSDFEEAHKTSLENANFNTKKFIEGLCTKNSDLKTSCSQNILSCLSLPSKEMLDSIVNNGESNRLLSNAETLNTNAIKSLPVSENDFLLHNESHLSYDSNTPAMSVTSGTELNTDFKSNALQNPNNSLLANDVLPVTELRKILEVVRSVSSDENNSESNSWKNKATFEYNHTRSAPMEQTSSNLNDLENVDVLNSSDTPFTSTPVESKTSNVTTEDHSFDDDDANDVPSNYESDFDKNETSDSKNEDKEEPEIPRYKSRWEKIMERKSNENKEMEQDNEHLLKDCFPVSAKLSSKKCNLSDETRVKTNNKKAKKSKKKESSKKFDMEPLNSKKKSSERKSKKNEWKSKASVTDYSKSKDIKKISTKLTVKKNKGKNTHIDDASNLFTPDKLAKSSNEKKVDTLKSNGTNPAKCFYGNRVTNRGTFLTNISTSEILKKIKIPKKKIPEAPKKLANVRSEEFHSMVKSPDINIDTRFVSSYKVRNKSNSYNKNKREFNNRSLNIHSSKSTYFPKNDRRSSYAETHSSGFHHTSFEENMQIKKIPLLATPPLLPQHLNDESILNRKAYMLHTSEPFQSNNQSVPLRVNYRNSHLSSTSSTSFHQRNENFLNSRIPILGTQPCNSFEFSSVSSFQTDHSPPTAILRNIISSAQLNNSSASLKDNIRPFPDCLNPLWNKTQLSLSSHTFKEQPTFSDQSDSMSDSFSTGASCVGDGPSISEHLVSQLSFQNFDAAFKAKGLHTIPFNSSPISDEVPKKAICLVPQHLKSLVGNETIDTSNVRLLMLEWSVDWLMQQQKNQDPPPISNGLKKVVSSYDSFEDYYNTYFPLMLLDTWHRIFVSWTHLNQSSPYFCEITSYSVKSTFVSVECQTVFNKTAHPKGVFPDEGSILMVKYGYKCKNYSIKILGYVTNVKTRHFNPVTDSKLSNYKQPKDGNYDVLQVLTLTFMGAYNSEDIDKRLPIRIHVLCNVKSTLKQNDALLYINKSPLRAIILNPVEDGLLSVPLTPRNSPQDKINECVREITKGIVSTHPLPLLTIVRAMPESDRLNIIPLLIKNMKSTYRTKVLLCVRTIKTLGDIAANICLHDSLKLVIINKRCDTNVQFQRYLLDELVNSEMNKIGDQSIMDRPYLRNEAVIRTKKQIFSDCDVILSLIRNCHDEFMETTFTETESVAQMCCIVDEANLCTEPETLIPILHGVSKLILIGDPEYTAKVLSETAKEYDYHRSFFHRAYDLDLITE